MTRAAIEIKTKETNGNSNIEGFCTFSTFITFVKLTRSNKVNGTVKYPNSKLLPRLI
ncbi:hypothetical protein D3C79_1069550 [compost metagenome]